MASSAGGSSGAGEYSQPVARVAQQCEHATDHRVVYYEVTCVLHE